MRFAHSAGLAAVRSAAPAAQCEHDVEHDGDRHEHERDEQVGVGEAHEVTLSAQDDAAAANRSAAAAPATMKVISFCSFAELTRVPMWS